MSGYELSFIDINGEDNSKLFFEKECDILEWVKNSYCLSDEDVEHFRIVKYLPNVTHSFDISYKYVSEEDLAKVKKSIENVGGKIAGVIINKIPIKPEEYKSTYYYGSTTSVEPTRRHQKADYQFETTGNIEENKKQEITEQLNEYLKNK